MTFARRAVTAAAALLASAAVAVAVAACGSQAAARTVPRTAGVCGTRASRPVHPRHVVWIVMENQAYGNVIGSHSAPYISRLARSCGLATRFTAEAHPSLPNYVAMTSGAVQGISDDHGPGSHPLTAPSIFSELGPHWRALEESMPHSCTPANAGDYAVRHNPAAYYVGVRASCARQDVPLHGTPPPKARFTFVTPNLCHDMHSCSVGTGDAWLAGWLPRLLRSHEYRTGSTVVFITWDEDDRSAHQHIPTLVVSPDTRPGTRSAVAFNHYSLLATTEDLLGVPRLANAARATPMTAAFGLR